MLKDFNAALALGSVVFRTIEAVFYTAAVVSLLSILTLSQELATALAADGAAYRTLSASLLATREHASLAGVFAFSSAALMYYIVFYRARLVPRWLSGFGIAAVLAMVTGCLLALFSNSDVTEYKALVAPIFVQETSGCSPKASAPRPLGRPGHQAARRPRPSSTGPPRPPGRCRCHRGRSDGILRVCP